MGDLLTRKKRKKYKVESTAELDAVYTSCKVYFKQDLNIIDRDNDVVFKRAIYFKIARELTKDSFNTIGDKVSRDHATVMHGVNVIFPNDIENNVERNKDYQELFKICKQEISEGFNKNKKRKDTLIHCNINLRDRIAILENQINKIPFTVRQKYRI